MRPPIHSKKHIVQLSQGTIAQSVANTEVLIESQELQSTTPTAVEEGAIVKAVFVEYWLGNASSTVVGSYTLVIVKVPGGDNRPDTTEMAALHDYTNKKNILFTSQALVPPTDGGQVMVMKQFFKIPKGKQRFGLGDELLLVVRNNNATSVSINTCGLAVFKEYT